MTEYMLFISFLFLGSLLLAYVFKFVITVIKVWFLWSLAWGLICRQFGWLFLVDPRYMPYSLCISLIKDCRIKNCLLSTVHVKRCSIKPAYMRSIKVMKKEYIVSCWRVRWINGAYVMHVCRIICNKTKKSQEDLIIIKNTSLLKSSVVYGSVYNRTVKRVGDICILQI